MAGIEPATDGLRNRCSTTELHWLLAIEFIAAKIIIKKPAVGQTINKRSGLRSRPQRAR
jgi:hypothetical protein